MKRLVAAAAIAFTLLGTGAAEASTVHTVQAGDTLWSIGVRNEMPYPVIQRTNGLTGSLIKVGQTLQIPEAYVVKSGDNLWQISQRYGLPVNTLRYINNDGDSTLYPGQVIYLATPVTQATGQVTTAVSTTSQRTSSQRTSSLSPADLDLFERLVSAEAKGEPFEGQAAVAGVVLNRVKSPDYPNTVRGVIMEYSGSMPAFSPVANGQIYQPAVASAKEAVRAALQGEDYSGGAHYFYNPALTSGDNWIRSRAVTTTIGHHVFAR